MRTIAIVNLKGGVGKTVTAINFAAILAGDHQKRALLVDADSQCNATEFFGADSTIAGNLAELLGGYASATWCIHSTRYKGLSILPASDRLMDLDLSAIKSKTVNAAALRTMAADLTGEDLYDYMIIDCPPAFNAASTAALLAADEVIIPIKLDAFSLRGMANLLRQVRNMREINPGLRVAGCLKTMWYHDATISEAEAQLSTLGLPIFGTRIRRTPKVDGMTFAQEPLHLYSPGSSAGIDYRRFVREYLEGGAGHGES